jgi:hypothetical protein
VGQAHSPRETSEVAHIRGVDRADMDQELMGPAVSSIVTLGQMSMNFPLSHSYSEEDGMGCGFLRHCI